MREAHAHIFQLGRSLTMLDCSGCSSRDEMLSLIRERSSTLRDDEWVLAHSVRPEGWDDPRWPTRMELDGASGYRPVSAWCFDYHSMAASSAALSHAGIHAGSTIDRGIVGVNEQGELTGMLYEHAALVLWSSVPEPSTADRRSLIIAACDHLKQLGFNEVHDLKSQDWLGPLLHDLQSEGITDQRFELFPLIKDLDATLATRSTWESDQLKLAGTKIFTDGALNSRTAWMLEEYCDTPSLGTPMMTAQEIDDAMLLSKSHNLPVAAHAIGDAAVRAVLDSIERTGCRDSGMRIEHLELVHPDDLPRFKALGVIASVQPCHLLPDIEALNTALHDRLDRVLPLRSLIDSGLEPGTELVFGSDVPIVRADHEDSLQAAIHRRRDGMDASDAIGMDQALTREESLTCFGV
ncbi:MAG: amidohydrolase family protein [Phycisphaerales bacterium]|nr:amidohydrolase family protein [Phycisphaerales bacterium]